MRNREKKRRAMRTQRESAAEPRAHRARARDHVRSRPLRIVIACAMMIFTLAITILPCYATAQGTNKLKFEYAIPFTDFSMNTGNGDVLVYQSNITGLLSNNMKSDQETFGQNQLTDQWWSIKCIAWNNTPTNRDHKTWELMTTPFTTAKLFDSSDNPSFHYSGIKIDGNGLYYYVTIAKTWREVYSFNSKTWLDGSYRGIIFRERLGINSATGYDDYIIANAFIGEYASNGQWYNTSRYRRLDVPQISSMTAENGLNTMQFEHRVPTAWFHDTNKASLSFHASDFGTYYRDFSTYEINSLKMPEIHIIHHENSISNLRVRVNVEFIVYEEDLLSTHTENTYRRLVYEDYLQYEPQNMELNFPGIPLKEIHDVCAVNGINLEDMQRIWIDRIEYNVEYDISPKSTSYGITYITFKQENRAYTFDNTEWISKTSGLHFNTYPTPSEVKGGDVTEWLADSISRIMSIDIFGDFGMGDLLMVTVAIGVMFIVIKLFMGG